MTTRFPYDRMAYRITPGQTPLHSAGGMSVDVFEDQACTIVPAITTVLGAPIVGARIVVDQTSLLPEFLHPSDVITSLWIRPIGSLDAAQIFPTVGDQVRQQVSDSTGGTPAPTPGTLVQRDDAGRFQAVAPAANADVATKAYVDTAVAGAGGGTSGGLDARSYRMIEGSSSFVRRMTEPIVQPNTDSQIKPTRRYEKNYVGQTEGRFTLTDANYGFGPIVDPPVTVADPADGPLPSFRGTVFGAVDAAVPTPTAYRVRALKNNAGAHYDTGLTCPVGSGRTWAIDLSSVETWRKGSWEFQLEEIASSTAYGAPWPTPATYGAVFVQHRVITDTSYIIETHPARVDGYFQTNASAMGLKEFRLIDADDNVMALSVPTTGAARSYLVSSGQQGFGTNFVNSSYVYDQGLALSAAIATRDDANAKRLVAGLLAFQTLSGQETGGFIFSGPYFNPSVGDATYRTGAHTVALYSLLQYIEAYPEDTSHGYMTAAAMALSWLDRYLDKTTGSPTLDLYSGGKGEYDPADGHPNLDYTITWYSTEHNLDAWHALSLAARIFGDPSYSTKANRTKAAIMATLWNTGLGRFNQGYQTTGPDTADALDLHSWGSIFLTSTGQASKAAQVLTDAALAPFKHTISGVTGYGVSASSTGYPGIVDNVWSEGTFGVVLAMKRLGQESRASATVAAIAPMQSPGGGFPYVMTSDATYGLTPYISVAGSAWAVLALTDGIWRAPGVSPVVQSGGGVGAFGSGNYGSGNYGG